VLGAHQDVRIVGGTCVPDSAVALDVAFRSPVEATEENVRAITAYSSTEQLVARVQGKSLPGAADLQRFNAEWREISFAHDRQLSLGPSDCDLIDSVRKQLLPKMSVRIVHNRTHCVGGSLLSAPRLTVSALVAVSR